jgi:hypothetical protein
MALVTLNELRKALKKTIGQKGMEEEDIGKLADYLLSVFGYSEEVVDNRLTMEERDVFYMLEEEGLLTTRQEEVHLKKGKLWRIHYWILKTDYIKKLSSAEKKENGVDYKDVYSKVSEDIWSRN